MRTIGSCGTPVPSLHTSDLTPIPPRWRNFLPGETFDSLEAMLLGAGRRNPRSTISSVLRARLPERLLMQLAPDTPLGRMTKDDRRRLVRDLVDYTLPLIRDRGFDYAEVTAGGVPLEEIDL